MIEQEMASIARFVLNQCGEISPYYWNVPESFLVPAVFFDTPEMTSGGETFLTYWSHYLWHIRFYSHSKQQAWNMCKDVFHAIKRARNLIPLIDLEGEEIENEGIRIDDPSMNALDENSALLTVSWKSRRPYDSTLIEMEQPKASEMNWGIFFKDSYIPDEKEVDRLLALTDLENDEIEKTA